MASEWIRENVIMTLLELITAVKEQNLSKDQLEGYRDQLSGLFAQMQLELAALEKNEALFMNKIEQDPHQSNYSVARMKVLWKGTQQGQRIIELKRYCLATKEMLNSLKSRLYSIY